MSSKIEWCDETWNPVTGCTKVSAGCKHANRLEQPLRWKKPRRVFVNSMSDLFHEDVDQRFISDVFGIMAACPQHTFQILTKRPTRALELLGQGCMGRFQDDVEECLALYTDATIVWPLPNVWLGVSVENQETADERIPLLLDTPAAVRWISAEPLLGAVDLTRIGVEGQGEIYPLIGSSGWKYDDLTPVPGIDRISWVVVGGESGPKARPMNPAWVGSLRDQCAAAGVPFLFKQWGEYLPIISANTPDGLTFWPDDGGETGRLKGRNATSIEAHGRKYARVGKRAAGRLLDGVLHDGYPDVRQSVF